MRAKTSPLNTATALCTMEAELVYPESYGENIESSEEDEQSDNEIFEDEILLRPQLRLPLHNPIKQKNPPSRSRTILFPLRNKALYHIRFGSKAVA